MDLRIKEIIEELVKLDPSFDNHRQELESVLSAMLTAKPDVKIDPIFVQKLRNQILTKENINENVLTKIQNNFMKKLVYTTAIGVVVVVLAVVGLKKYGLNTGSLSSGTDVRITRASAEAFGDLSHLTSAQGLGGGGGPTLDAIAPNASGDKSAPQSALRYEPVQYKFVYKGDDLNLTADKLDVLKKAPLNLNQAASSLGQFGLGLIDLGSFDGSAVQSISFGQTKGYNTYVDLNSGMISLSSNEDYGIKPLASDATLCPTTGCPTPKPIDPADVPDDASLIAIANGFIQAHSIATNAYAEPEVVHPAMANETFLYQPEVVSVVYPLKINDGKVYDESGNLTGLMVSISLRTKKDQGVWNIGVNNYEASSYDAVTDPSVMLSIAQKGGMYGYTGDPSGKVVEVDLGTPTQEYVAMWDYSNNIGQQVLVPSLVFPVTDQPKDSGFQNKAVVVPLIKAMLNANNPVNIFQGAK